MGLRTAFDALEDAMSRYMPRPPAEYQEYDFRQMSAEKPRISARVKNGKYELFTVRPGGIESVVVTNYSWAKVYRAGRRMADGLSGSL